MTKQEKAPRSITEKTIWWAKIGGVTAAILGALRHITELTTAGVAVTVGAYAAEGLIYKRPKTA